MVFTKRLRERTRRGRIRCSVRIWKPPRQGRWALPDERRPQSCGSGNEGVCGRGAHRLAPCSTPLNVERTLSLPLIHLHRRPSHVLPISIQLTLPPNSFHIEMWPHAWRSLDTYADYAVATIAAPVFRAYLWGIVGPLRLSMLAILPRCSHHGGNTRGRAVRAVERLVLRTTATVRDGRDRSTYASGI